MVSVTSSLLRPVVYSSNLGSSGLSAITDDGTHKNVSPKIQVVTSRAEIVCYPSNDQCWDKTQA